MAFKVKDFQALPLLGRPFCGLCTKRAGGLRPAAPRGDLRPRFAQLGFTIVELLVIVAIIGVLATIAIPQYSSYINKAKVTLAIGTLDAMRVAMEGFHVDHQEYPSPPIDFANTGLDSDGRGVFTRLLVDQMKNDFFSIDSYVLLGDQWEITAKANDDKRTVLKVSPTGISR
jgi:Tfp pilus assembly protein PilE